MKETSKTAQPIIFEAKICRPVEGGDWTFLRLPQEASGPLPSRGLVSVDGAMNGFAFQATLQPDGEGGHWLKVEPNLREGANVRTGDTVHLEISPSTVEPEPDVPEDLREALSAAPAALAVWTAITPVARRDWIQWMTTGKRAETRTLRTEKMMDMLSKGKRRICCFDRSGKYSQSLSCPSAAPD
jgi:hypothetical protein